MKFVKIWGLVFLSVGISVSAFADTTQTTPTSPEQPISSIAPAKPSTTTPTTTTTTPSDTQTYSKENCVKMMENCATNKEEESTC